MSAAINVAETKWNLKTNWFVRYIHLYAIFMAFVLPLSGSLTTLLSLLILISSFIAMRHRTFMELNKYSITRAVILFLLVTLGTYWYTIAGEAEVSQALRKVARLLLIPLLLPHFMNSSRQHALILTFISAVAISVAIMLIWPQVYLRDQIFTGLFVSLAAYCCAQYAYDFRKYKWLFISLIAGLAYYQFFVGISRIGQLLFFVLGGMFFWQHLQFKRATLLAAIGLVVAIACAITLVPNTFVERYKIAIAEIANYTQVAETEVEHTSSLGTRLILVHNSWELIKQRPFLGWGIGSYRAAYEQAPEFATTGVARTNPHNQYLLTWVEFGLLGVVCLFYLILVLFKNFVPQNNIQQRIGLGVLLSFVIGCVFNSWLLDCTSMYFFALMFGVLFSINEKSS